jgi:hypothetical protein
MERDPVSVLHDRGARAMLAQVYAVPRGTWVMTRLADPTERHLAWARGQGWDLMGPDNAVTRSGKKVNAHTRWGRAFMRALWYQHKHYGPNPGRGSSRKPGVRDQRRAADYGIPLQLEWGRRLPGSPNLPRGRAVRVRTAYGGRTALRVVQAKQADDRIWEDDGEPGGRFALAGERDW